jgi:hypothetical protein
VYWDTDNGLVSYIWNHEFSDFPHITKQDILYDVLVDMTEKFNKELIPKKSIPRKPNPRYGSVPVSFPQFQDYTNE